ncbi:hypothetical protein NEOLEDRAFT_989237 [Neolentinus lepideus HHB14362 ss-1]|uniref:Uncharacterized protein n=1 Tax=Neolentinus lepideus HHB14362 ss-1 TaxID=1314782 RepID=A0A165N4A3_9AGAM|nr:hypothetical protein NEOLEDRAFT_989237 [Neolentinus lepideus HHB14362 ss-1]
MTELSSRNISLRGELGGVRDACTYPARTVRNTLQATPTCRGASYSPHTRISIRTSRRLKCLLSGILHSIRLAMTQKSPWAWQSPPLPSTFSVVSQSLDTPHERIWYRKLWGLEASMAVCTYTLPGMADIIISCHLRPPSGSLVPIEEALVKSAVRALRFEQPIIATKLAFTDVEPGDFPRPEEGRFVYEVPASEEDVDRWLNEVVTIHTDVSRSYTDIDSAVTAVTRDLSSVGSAPPTTLFELHFVPSVGEDRTCVVILRMGHALFDGIGCWLFLDAFNAKLAWMLGDPLRAQQKLLWGEEVSRLTGAVPDRLKVPWAPDKIEDDQVMVEKLREAATLPKVATPISTFDSISLIILDCSRPEHSSPNWPRIQDWNLSTRSSSSDCETVDRVRACTQLYSFQHVHRGYSPRPSPSAPSHRHYQRHRHRDVSQCRQPSRNQPERWRESASCSNDCRVPCVCG